MLQFEELRAPQTRDHLYRRLRVVLLLVVLFSSSVFQGTNLAGRVESAHARLNLDHAIFENVVLNAQIPGLYLDELERHVPYAESQWHDFSSMGYFGRGTCVERGVRTAANYAYVYAFLYVHSLSDQFSGVPRDRVLEHAIRTIGYLASSHKSVAKAACADGRQWGLVWQSAMWSSQLGMAAWMLWDKLDSDTKADVQVVITNEADQIASRTPPFAEYGDTKAEENGWDSNIVSLAPAIFPHDPRSAAWDFSAKEYMMNTLSVAQDLRDRTVVEGRPVSDWVHGANLHSDYTAENHNIFHPVYNMVTLHELGNSALAYGYSGREVPATVRHHVLDVWENVLKTIVLADGEWVYPNGLDWMIHDYEHLPTFAWLATYFQDSSAALIESRLAAYLHLRQSLQIDVK